MILISFEDNCTIKRGVSVDEFDEPIQTVVYSGVCYYQQGSYVNSQQMLVQNPIVFLPDVSLSIETNDIVEINTKFDRHLESVVLSAREIELPITREKFTRLELKQANVC